MFALYAIIGCAGGLGAAAWSVVADASLFGQILAGLALAAVIGGLVFGKGDQA